MPTRRDFLTGSALTLSWLALPRTLSAAPNTEQAKLEAYFADAAAEVLRWNPEFATALGLDKDELAWTKYELADASPTAAEQDKARVRARLGMLRAIDRTKLSSKDAVNYDTVEFLLAVMDEANRKFAYGNSGGGAPYVLTQLNGAYHDVPDFLDSQHVISTKSDADAYLARLEAFSRVLDQERELVRRDQGLGVVPPDFAIDKALVQLKTLLAYALDASPLVVSLVRRTKQKNIAGKWAEQAGLLYGEKVRPALERQVQLLTQLRAKATHEAGVHRLPSGAEYYANGLRRYTTSDISPEEVHKTGLELVASLGSRADALMQKVGYTKGTVGERYRALAEDPKQLYPNTAEGKAKLLAKLNEQVKVITTKLPQWFGQLPKAPLEIRAVPAATEAGAPGGYYNPPSLDGSRPGIYWVNLRDTAELAAWTLPTLTYHEGIPGHHLQLSLNNEAGDLPLLRKMVGFSGYSEGWALYAEELAAEMGMYEHDPYGHLGMVHDALFRAVRLVVDSGMHHKRWSRERALKYYVDNIGDPEPSAITEIERYSVSPGQASSYMVGKLTWLRARERAQQALGARFDIRKFHDAGLLAGGTPLTVLDRVIDDYIAADKAL